MRLFIGGSNGLVLYEDEEVTGIYPEKVFCLAKLPAGKLFAGTQVSSVVVVENHSGARIVAKDLGEAVHGLAAAGRAVWAGSMPAGLWRSKDQGETWSEMPAFSNAPGRQDWSAPWGIPLVSGVCPHPKDPRTLYCGVEVGGLYRTTDGGRSWFDIELPSADVHAIQISPCRPERVYVTTGAGPFCSDDEGMTWRAMGSREENRYSMGLSAHPTEGERVIVSAATGPPGSWKSKKGASCDVYLSTDAGRRFRRVAEGLRGAVQRRALVINPKVPSEVVFGTSTGELHYSNDGGETFDLMAEGLGDIKALLFA